MSDPSVPGQAASNRPRVERVRTGDTYETHLHNPKGIAAAIGEATLASFYRCFMGVERILAFEHLIFLNNKAEKSDPPHVEADRFAFMRNTRLLVFLLAGTMYELGAALQALCATGVVHKITDRAAWAPLDKLRGEWNTDKYAKTIRNGFAHHLGEIDDYRKGIMRPDSPDPVVFHQLIGRHRGAGEFVEPWNALFHAHKITDEDMERFIEKTRDAHLALPELMYRFFAEVLESNGIEIIEIG